MPDAARQYPLDDTASRQATAPLRDWLAQIRAQAAAVQAQSEEREPAFERAERASWAPRLVPQAPEPVAEEIAEAAAEPDEAARDISELMAENMLLKAQLRLEGDRYAELQAMIAEEIRELRRHVEGEMRELVGIREERDLWRARAEALAQPLFQGR